MAHQKKVAEAGQVLAVSFQSAAEEVHSVEACEYAEVGTDRVGKELLESQDRTVEEGHSGTGEAHFGNDVVHSGIGADHPETEEDHFEIGADHLGMVEVRSGTEVRSLAHQADLDTAGVVQMLGYACQVARNQAVAEGTAIVEVEQTVMAVAGTEFPVGYRVADMMSKLNYWEALQIAFEAASILESQPAYYKVSHSQLDEKHHQPTKAPGLWLTPGL